MYFQLHCIRQQGSRYTSARKLKKVLLLFSKKKKRQTKQKAKASKSFGNPLCKKSKQKQTNKEWFEYHLVSGSRDISQLWSTHESVQSVYLIYKNYIFNMDTCFLWELKDSSNFYAHRLSRYTLSVIYLLDLSCCFKPMLPRNVSTEAIRNM